MTKKIAIFGAGGFAREVLQIIQDINAGSLNMPVWNPVGFIVDPDYVSEKIIHGLPILGSIEWLKSNPDTEIVIAIGSPSVRLNKAQNIEQETSNKFATLVHPKAWVGRQVQLSKGAIICAGALITTDIRIGDHVHVNIGCTIGHDAVIQDFVTLNPSVNVSGNVNVGVGVEVGTRSVLIPYAHVGEWSVLGAGTVVTKPLPANVTAVGSPAKVIKTRMSGWHLSSHALS